MKAAIFIVIIGLSAGLAFQQYYYEEKLTSANAELDKKSQEVNYLLAKFTRMNDKLYTADKKPKPTYKEKVLFDEQYLPPEECQGINQERNWAKCVDIRRHALHDWVEEYRANI
ncbi:hypothetical protein A3765_08460 [Oleiphilus sp. HI0130]|nr:hypothetical protein A3765_21485 [Oleiphilus sp. HI0130]KZZ78005.1 hypothetical protein A3765_08460 [Oleiphilus sp. HI0130]